MSELYDREKIPDDLQQYFVRAEHGLEPTPEAYVENLVEVFREVRRVLAEDGTLWLNLGDSYAGSWGAQSRGGPPSDKSTLRGNGHVGGGPKVNELSEVQVREAPKQESGTGSTADLDLKPKDMVGIPWRVAFALQADGWWLRSDIIWCLSGGTRVYARTQKGVHTTTIKDLARLDPSTVELWNGETWTQVLGISESPRPDDPIKLKLRSGERIGCTPDHKWPLADGRVVEARNLSEGDVIDRTELPEPDSPERPKLLPDYIGWLVGYYLAEGSQDSRGRLQFAAHVDETDLAADLEDIVNDLGGTLRCYVDGNKAAFRVSGGVAARVADMYLGGSTAKTKRLSNACWRRSDAFLGYLLEGYLAGDGHYDNANERWRLGFTRNDGLASDLRTLCARLGYTLTLNPVQVEGFGETHAAYRGEIRKHRSDHHNEKPRSEIVEVGRSRARKFYDIGVADAPHTFALASGVLTHNSKPNPMPESVTDRPTSSHEHIFLLAKSRRYYYDHEAIAEPCGTDPSERYPERARVTGRGTQGSVAARGNDRDKSGGFPPTVSSGNKERKHGEDADRPDAHLGRSVPWEGSRRNKRDVWTVTTKPYPDAHFAVYPPELITPCIKAGTSQRGQCVECGAPCEREVEGVAPDGRRVKRVGRGYVDDDGNPATGDNMIDPGERGSFTADAGEGGRKTVRTETVGWTPTCDCDADTEPQLVLDPFAGAGTTGVVCTELGRRFLGIELNPEYAEMARERILGTNPTLFRGTA